MKNNPANSLIILCILIAVTFSTGCATTSLQHLSADEFLEYAKEIEVISSGSWIEYVGISNDRAYLEFNTLFVWFGGDKKTTVYWTELNELPPSVAKQLNDGTPPWAPWDKQKFRQQNGEFKSLFDEEQWKTF
jgi:hypothetical protein